MTTPASAAQRAASFRLEEATIGQVQQAIRSRQITTVALVEQYLQRIRAYNGTCVNEPDGILGVISTIPHARQINALSTLNLRPATRAKWGFDGRKARSLTAPKADSPDMPDALEVASAQDRAFARTGRLAGPLHGAVMAIKDQYDTFDMRTTSGADAGYANDRPPSDATFVKRLRNAGAIILAKATVVSVRWPSAVNSLVGLAPTKELVSTRGMIGAGLNMRVGPMCRTVEDAARILDVIAGYDPKDEMTVFSIGRKPARPYASYAAAWGTGRLDGVRIGVLREYMSRKLFAKADEESIDIIERAIDDIRKLGATIVDPVPDKELFKDCLARYAPRLMNSAFARQYPQLFGADQILALLDLDGNPNRVPEALSLRTLNAGGIGPSGEGKFEINRYLRERGDENIRSNADLIAKSRFYTDPNFPDRKQARERDEGATVLDTSVRLQGRFAMQTMLLQCMQEQTLDALVSPMSTVPPRKLTSPREPAINGRTPIGWSLIGQQGFPAITVPAGFTTAVWDRVAGGNDGARLVGPVAARLPVGVDFIALPFGEPLLFRIASAYEAATRHRRPPPDFGPVEAPATRKVPKVIQ